MTPRMVSQILVSSNLASASGTVGCQSLVCRIVILWYAYCQTSGTKLFQAVTAGDTVIQPTPPMNVPSVLHIHKIPGGFARVASPKMMSYCHMLSMNVYDAGTHAETRKRFDIYKSVGCLSMCLSLSIFLSFSLFLSLSFSVFLSFCLFLSYLTPFSRAARGRKRSEYGLRAGYGCMTDRFVTQAGRHAETRKRVDIYKSIGCRMFISMSLSLYISLFFFLYLSLFIYLFPSLLLLPLPLPPFSRAARGRK